MNRIHLRIVRCAVLSGMILLALAASAAAQSPGIGPPAAVPSPALPRLPDPLADALRGGPESWTSPQRLSSTLQVMLLLTVLSLAPANKAKALEHLDKAVAGAGDKGIGPDAKKKAAELRAGGATASKPKK